MSPLDDDELPELTVRQMSISEEIQTQLLEIIAEYLDERPSLIDALNWILTVVVNDELNGLNVYGNSFRDSKRNPNLMDDDYIEELYPEAAELEGEDDDVGGYICRGCAARLGAVFPEDHVCTFHTGICDFCLKKESLCHTSDWNWPVDPRKERGREL